LIARSLCGQRRASRSQDERPTTLYELSGVFVCGKKTMQVSLTDIENTLLLFSNLHDPDTESHSLRTAELCIRLAQQLAMSVEDIEDLRFSALFHDVGKVGVDRHILNKAGALTEGEWAMIHMHPVFGYKILASLDVKATIRNAVRSHHENFDGSGYPDKLLGEQIPIFARIIRIADTYDALLTDRPDRPAISQADALSVLWQYSKCFDLVLLREFENLLK
jgi:putative nucleotidyltransferase with HDIG domain